MTMTPKEILAKAIERAEGMANTLNQMKTIDVSARAAVSELSQLSESYRLDKVALGNLVGELFKTLPDGRRIFTPDLEALEHVCRAIGETVEWIIARAKFENGRVVSLRLHQTPLKDLRPLTTMTELRDISLWSTDVRELEPLRSLTKLQALGLSSTLVENIAPLTALQQLSHLSLCNTKIESIEPIAKLPALQELHLSRSAIGGRDEGRINELRARGVYVSFS